MKQHKAAMNQANTTSFMSAMDVENKLRYHIFYVSWPQKPSRFIDFIEIKQTNKSGLFLEGIISVK